MTIVYGVHRTNSRRGGLRVFEPNQGSCSGEPFILAAANQECGYVQAHSDPHRRLGTLRASRQLRCCFGQGHARQGDGHKVSAPFHNLRSRQMMVTDTLESYTARLSTVAAKRLPQVKDIAAVGWCRLRRRACPERASIPSNYRHGDYQRMRPDCDGFTWPAWDFCYRAWQ